MLFTHNPETPLLIQATVPILLRLISKTAGVNSEDRFNRLCLLLGKIIIGGLWVNIRDSAVIAATYTCLPSITALLGIGTIKYLKVTTS